MFSEKYGYMPEKVIQYEKVSDELRNRIWNLFYQHEIKAGGISSKSFTQVLTGEQTMEEKIADKMGLLIDSAGKHKSATEQLKDNVIRFSHGLKYMTLLIFISLFLKKMNVYKGYNNIMKSLNRKRQDTESSQVKLLRSQMSLRFFVLNRLQRPHINL